MKFQNDLEHEYTHTRGVPEIRGKVLLLYFCLMNSNKTQGHVELTIV